MTSKCTVFKIKSKAKVTISEIISNRSISRIKYLVYYGISLYVIYSRKITFFTNNYLTIHNDFVLVGIIFK